jgi:hypothetical protein
LFTAGVGLGTIRPFHANHVKVHGAFIFSTALIFKLLQDTVTLEQSVQLIYKADSRDVTSPKVITLGICNNALSCPLKTLQEHFQDYSALEWCQECGNDSAAVCLTFMREDFLDENCGVNEPFWTGLFLGLGIFVILSLLFCFCSSAVGVFFGSKGSTNTDSGSPPAELPETVNSSDVEVPGAAIDDVPESPVETNKDAVLT